ncbi:TPA: hypothetical protein DCQ44_03570 [Candidatus Taylorbacteria bacterium]|nr:hypothetical protein [Candidatus Taylorbacteria bacterium]
MKFSGAKKTKGFTLIEMLVAVFVFSIIMVIATGAIFSVISANKTSQALKSVMDNLNSALDTMSRNIRYGTTYDCGFTGASQSCLYGTRFAFLDRLGVDTIIYDFRKDSGSDTGTIYRCVNGLADDHCVRLTAQEVRIQNVNFNVVGANDTETEQPQVIMTISGYAQAGAKKSYFNIETMVEQRNLSLCKITLPAAVRANCP